MTQSLNTYMMAIVKPMQTKLEILTTRLSKAQISGRIIVNNKYINPRLVAHTNNNVSHVANVHSAVRIAEEITRT